MQFYPILLEPIYKEKVWGGRHLERLGRSLPGDAGKLIGESWEVSDLASTAVGGGGGGAARSVVSNGPLAGRTLTELVREQPDALLGEARAQSPEAFPLLVKYLDARQNLSVQVHPTPAYAAGHPGAQPKSEAWYIVDAEPGAVLYVGLRPGTRREDVERAIEKDAVTDLLVEVPAVVGACHYVPSGVCHALGAGIVVAEVETPSDTTFRLYDWGRTDRELHVTAALDCMDYGPSGSPTNGSGGTRAAAAHGRRSLVECAHFGIEEWRGEPGSERAIDLRGPEVWMVIEGAIEVRSRAHSFEPVTVSAGGTVLLPACLGTTAAIVEESLLMLRVTVPQAP